MGKTSKSKYLSGLAVSIAIAGDGGGGGKRCSRGEPSPIFECGELTDGNMSWIATATEE